jgi:hypothetical protein
MRRFSAKIVFLGRAEGRVGSATLATGDCVPERARARILRHSTLAGHAAPHSTTGVLRCEETKIEEKLGTDAGNLVKIETPSGAGWSYVAGSTSLVAFDLSKFGFQTPITYFAVKFGNAADDFYVFKNVDNLQYAVIDLSTITASAGKITTSSLSHISTVPEPGTLILTGLLGLGLASARRFYSARNA